MVANPQHIRRERSTVDTLFRLSDTLCVIGGFAFGRLWVSSC